jgi:hypothetical protein
VNSLPSIMEGILTTCDNSNVSTPGRANGPRPHLTACHHEPPARRTASRNTRRFSAGPSYGTRSGAGRSWAAHDSSELFAYTQHVLRTTPRQRAAPLCRAERLLNEPLAYRLNGRRAAPKPVPLDLAGQPLAERRAEEDVLGASLRGKHHQPKPLHDHACVRQNPRDCLRGEPLCDAMTEAPLDWQIDICTWKELLAVIRPFIAARTSARSQSCATGACKSRRAEATTQPDVRAAEPPSQTTYVGHLGASGRGSTTHPEAADLPS